MTDGHRPKHDEKADRVLAWLYERRGEFEGSGVSEASLAAAVGLPEAEVTEAVDHLENREVVVRMPGHGDAAPGFKLEPGRGWGDACEELAKS
jgi:hypothetical protein